jgi:transcriptional coactivator p15 (PC4)
MSAPVIIAVIAKNSRETVRIALDQYHGADLVDIRVTVELNAETKVPIPTKKGISLRIEQLPELIAALQAAEAEARKRGLLEKTKRRAAA